MKIKDDEQTLKNTLNIIFERSMGSDWSDVVWIVFVWFPVIAIRITALLIRYGILELIDRTLGRCSARILLWNAKRSDKLCEDCDLFCIDLCYLAYNHFKDQLSDFDRNIVEISLQELSE